MVAALYAATSGILDPDLMATLSPDEVGQG
jgi:hypothetical protein